MELDKHSFLLEIQRLARRPEIKELVMCTRKLCTENSPTTALQKKKKNLNTLEFLDQ